MGLHVPIIVGTVGHFSQELQPLVEVREGILAVAVRAVEKTVRRNQYLLSGRLAQKPLVPSGAVG